MDFAGLRAVRLRGAVLADLGVVVEEPLPRLASIRVERPSIAPFALCLARRLAA